MIISCEDNLSFIKNIPDGSIQLIYSDVLFGTGRNFGDYQDLNQNYDEIESHYLPRL